MNLTLQLGKFGHADKQLLGDDTSIIEQIMVDTVLTQQLQVTVVNAVENNEIEFRSNLLKQTDFGNKKIGCQGRINGAFIKLNFN